MDADIYEILDDILDSFSTEKYIRGDVLWISVLEIGVCVSLKRGDKYSGRHVLEGTKKLHKEGYLREHQIETQIDGDIDYSYSLLFDGYLLIKNGGYGEMMKRERADAKRKELYEFLVAMGAAVAMIYALAQTVEAILTSLAVWKAISGIL